MKIKIIENPASLIASLTNLGKGSYTIAYRDTLESVAGQFVDVDTKYLFIDQFNAIINGELYHVPATFVSEVEDDARVGYPWIHVPNTTVTCYSESSIDLMERRGEIRKLTVDYYPFFESDPAKTLGRHSAEIKVVKDFSLQDVQQSLNNYEKSIGRSIEIEPEIDTIAL